MSLEERIEKLERDNRGLVVKLRWLRSVGAAVVFLNVAAFTLGATPNQIPDVIRAKRFEVIGGGEDSQVAAMMGANDEGAGVVQIYNKQGRTAVDLRTTRQGPGTMTTYSEDGFSLVSVGVFTDGGGLVTVDDGKGRSLVVLGRNSHGDGHIQTLNGAGHQLATLDSSADGRGLLAVFDGQGWSKFEASSSSAGHGRVRTFGAGGIPFLTISGTAEAGAEIYAFDPNQILKATWPPATPEESSETQTSEEESSTPEPLHRPAAGESGP